MFREYLNRRENFKKLLKATELIGSEFKSYGYEYWLSQQESEIHFQRNVEGLNMHFDIDWYKQNDGKLFIDIVGRGSLPTNFGVQPRCYFVVFPEPKVSST